MILTEDIVVLVVLDAGRAEDDSAGELGVDGGRLLFHEAADQHQHFQTAFGEDGVLRHVGQHVSEEFSFHPEQKFAVQQTHEVELPLHGGFLYRVSE